MLSVIAELMSDRQQCVAVDGCSSQLADVVSGVPQGSVLGSLLFILYTAELLTITGNPIISYADDSTLISTCHRPGVRVSITDSINNDLFLIDQWSS